MRLITTLVAAGAVTILVIKAKQKPPPPPPPPPLECPAGYHLENGVCVPDVIVPPPQPSGLHFLATYHDYVSDSGQLDAYLPLTGVDAVRLRSSNKDSTSFTTLIDATMLANGRNIGAMLGAEVKTARQTVAIAADAKANGMEFMQLNIENSTNFDLTEYANLIASYKKAADACHVQGLLFNAAPMYSDALKHGVELSKFCEWIHVQTQGAQNLDSTGTGFKKRLTDVISKVRAGNPSSTCRFTCQVSTQRSTIAGKSMLETMKICTLAVKDVPELDYITVWFGGTDLPILKSYVQWFKATLG